jgi:anti-sigma regulatory factor (Ser/Thr protein kinase)
MTASSASTCFELKMSFAPGMVSIVRRFVESAAEQLGVAEDASIAIAMAVHELAENIAKYGLDRQGVIRLDVHSEGSNRAQLVITVTNQAHPHHIDRLKQHFREMNADPDPMHHYFSLLGRATPDGGSGIGLARIQAEADMRLGLSVAGNRVSVSATSLPFTPSVEAEPA